MSDKLTDLEQQIEIWETELDLIEDHMVQLQNKIDEAKEILRRLDDNQTP